MTKCDTHSDQRRIDRRIAAAVSDNAVGAEVNFRFSVTAGVPGRAGIEMEVERRRSTAIKRTLNGCIAASTGGGGENREILSIVRTCVGISRIVRVGTIVVQVDAKLHIRVD